MRQPMYNYIEVLKWAHKALREKEMRPSERFLFLYLLHRANECYWKPLSLYAEIVSKETGIARTSLFKYKSRLVQTGFLLEGEQFNLNFNFFPKDNENHRRRSKNLEVSSITEEDFTRPI